MRETHQRHPHSRAVDHPGFVGPRIEDRPSVRCSLQRPSVRPAAYGVGRDEPAPASLACLDFLACICEPVTDKVGFRRYAASPCSEETGHVILAELTNQELATEKRRVADHDICLRPRRLGPVRRQNRVPALDGRERLEYRRGSADGQGRTIAPRSLEPNALSRNRRRHPQRRRGTRSFTSNASPGMTGTEMFGSAMAPIATHEHWRQVSLET